MQKEIIAAIAEYLEEETAPSPREDRLAVEFGGVINRGHFTHAGFCQEIATEIAAAIAPHLEAGAGWEDAPSWAGWRIEYSDGSHNFSRGYPGIITTGVVKVECRTK